MSKVVRVYLRRGVLSLSEVVRVYSLAEGFLSVSKVVLM